MLKYAYVKKSKNVNDLTKLAESEIKIVEGALSYITLDSSAILFKIQLYILLIGDLITPSVTNKNFKN